jgi:hypothetical protein
MTREIEKYKITLEVESNFPGFANGKFIEYLKKYKEEKSTEFKIVDWKPQYKK